MMIFALGKKPVLAQFVKRVNRFTVEVTIDGYSELAHLPNSGRLRSILQTGHPCWVTQTEKAVRKTRYDLLAMELPAGPVLVDARLPGQVISTALMQQALHPLAGYDRIKSEYVYGKSRLDFFLQGEGLPPCLVEVKSASDYAKDIARFPDAPSTRARRHLQELRLAVENGWRGVVLLAAQMPWAIGVQLNSETDPEFVEVARQAHVAGVEFYAYVVSVRLPEGIELGDAIPVHF